MSQQDNFSSGFFLGAIVGGVVGGVFGAWLTAQRLGEEMEPSGKSELPDAKSRRRKSSLKPSSEQNIELARRSLEDKIAQLNDAIDDVRQQLSTVNGRAMEVDRENPLPEDS
jgi:gas vesicle protein